MMVMGISSPVCIRTTRALFAGMIVIYDDGEDGDDDAGDRHAPRRVTYLE